MILKVFRINELLQDIIGCIRRLFGFFFFSHLRFLGRCQTEISLLGKIRMTWINGNPRLKFVFFIMNMFGKGEPIM